MNLEHSKQILETTKKYEDDIYKLCSDLIRIESFSGNEKELADFIAQTMKNLNYDSVEIDEMGNVIGIMGNPSSDKKCIAVDGHMDVVEYGDVSQWKKNPISGEQDDKYIYGRGASDMKSAIGAMIYAGRIIKDLGFDKNFTYMACATVQEEPCEGLAWEYLIEKKNIKPSVVILGEPSDDKIAFAQRGRMELSINVTGKSAHAANPSSGDNAIYRMAKIVTELEALNANLDIEDSDLGKGCLVVSEITSSAASRSSVADACSIVIDRRLTWGESPDYALNLIKSLPSVIEAKAVVEPFFFTEPSYTGMEAKKECIFPAWKIEKNSTVMQSAITAYKALFEKDAKLSAWPFSTNGVAIMGIHGIPVVGYGPGTISSCHVADEFVLKEQIIKATNFFVGFSYNFSQNKV